MNKPIIFIICGKARTGKNTVSDIIKNYYKNSITFSYTKYLKEYAKMISDWDGSEETKPRELLQTLGTDIIKNQIDNKLLIRRTIEDINVLSHYKDVIIISGARRKDEIDDIKKVYDNVIAIKVYKDKLSDKLTDNENRHITETDLDDYTDFDYEINNDSNINELKDKVYSILKELNYEE